MRNLKIFLIFSKSLVEIEHLCYNVFAITHLWIFLIACVIPIEKIQRKGDSQVVLTANPLFLSYPPFPILGRGDKGGMGE